MASEFEQKKSLAWNLLIAGKYREARDEYHYLILDYGDDQNIKKLHKISGVLDDLEYELKLNGTKNIKKMNNFYIQLSNISNEWRELADTAYFKALLTEIGDALTTRGIHDLKQIQEVDTSLLSSGIINKIIYPKGIMNGITFCFAILVSVIIINYLIYLYLEAQPLRITLPDAKWGWAHAPLPSWHGLLELSAPVDNIILGDSTAGVNVLTGPITDRFGGSTINLGTNAGGGILVYAWMLEKYIQRWGTPRNVLLICTNNTYEYPHNTEYMAVVPLGWGYWDNIAPNWGKGELVDLFIKKYIVIYSNSDILANRLLSPLTVFKQPYTKAVPSLTYSLGYNTGASDMDSALKSRPAWAYGPFKPSLDSTIALKFMSNLAEKRGFNFYIIAGPECDEIFADPARKARLSSWYNYVAQFAELKNVYVIPNTPVLFKKELMQNPNHLRPEAERVYTEKFIDAIASLQNSTSNDNQLKLVSTKYDKSTYKIGEIPSLTVSIADGGQNEIHGAVSCSIFKSGSTESEWSSRASAVNYDLGNARTIEVNLILDKGRISDPGKYDVVIFVRINDGDSFKEIKFTVPNILEVD